MQSKGAIRFVTICLLLACLWQLSFTAVTSLYNRKAEKRAEQIAQTADGQYYRATSNSKLKEVYEEIDKLEKTKLNVKDFSRKNEEFMPFALAAVLCILLELLLRLTLLRRIP